MDTSNASLKATLGRTGLTVNKDGFGALPLQRCGTNEAATLLRAALAGGIDFFDTARSYSDSEEKIGNALADRRDEFILATKTPAQTPAEFEKDLAESLRLLKTDHIDIYQFHNPGFCPLPGDGSGLYEAMTAAKKAGKIRFIGLTNHREEIARQAVESGAYDTLQYPLSYLAGRRDLELAELCARHNVGFIAMKALAGGLITNVAAARAWLARLPGAVPIWGLQRLSELDALLAAQKQPAALTPQMERLIEKDRTELGGEFCHGCGYCLPCPADIEIHMCARMALLLRRAPVADFTTPAWREKMAKIENCQNCGACAKRCPYGLNTPELLRRNLADFNEVVAAL